MILTMLGWRGALSASTGRRLGFAVAVASAGIAMQGYGTASAAPPPGPIITIPEVKPGPKRGMTIEDEIRIREIKAAYLSPAGDQVLFQLNQRDPVANTIRSAWFVTSTAIAARARFLADAGDADLVQSSNGLRVGEVLGREAAWSRDGRSVAFIRQERGQAQIWVVPAAGGTPVQLSHNAADVVEFAWSADGSSILYTVGRDRAALAAAARDEGLRGYLYDDRIDPDYPSEIEWPLCMEDRFSEIEAKYACDPTTWVVSVASGAERQASEQEIAVFRRLRHPDAVQRLVEGQDVQLVTPSPDGKRLAWIENVNPTIYTGVEPPMVVVVSSTASRTGGARCASDKCSGWIDGLWWNAASGEVVFERHEGHRKSLTAFYAWKPGNNTARKLLSSDAAFTDCGATVDRLICVRADWTLPTHIVAIGMRDGRLQTVFNPNPEFVNLQFPKIEKLEWVDKNGNEALGHFVYPALYEKGRRYPCVVVSYSFWGYMKAVGDEHAIFPMAQQGFAVLYYSIPFTDETKKIANIRQRNAKDWSTSRAEPLNWALDELDRRGLIDTRRIGISGISNGATMVDEAILSTQRFAAASAGYSNTHPVSYYLVPESIRETSRIMAGGEPLAGGLAYWKSHSPGMNPEKIHTPLLLNVADREVMEAVANYVSLKDASKPVEMYVFPDEYHVKWQPAHKYNVYRRNMQWFLFWLQGKEVDDPVDPDQYKRWEKLCDMQVEQNPSQPAFCIRSKAH